MVRNFLCRLPLLLLPFSTGFAETPAAASSWHPSGAGMLAAPVLNEVSGMAASRLDPGRFWVLNDSGNKPALYAISGKGELLGTLEIEGAKNRDWEDLASFSLGGKNYLLIGDMGDNAGRRRDCRLYLVEEPAAVSVSGKAEPLAGHSLFLRGRAPGRRIGCAGRSGKENPADEQARKSPRAL